MIMAISFVRVGIYNQGFFSMKSPDSLIAFSCKFTKNVLAAVLLLPQGMWSLNLAMW